MKYLVKFWFEGSERFIWVGESGKQAQANKIAEKFANKNCLQWHWANNNSLIRGVTKDLPAKLLISISQE